MIKEEKIGNYQLGLEDHNIKGEDIKYRVDINYMYFKIFNMNIIITVLFQIIEENKKNLEP